MMALASAVTLLAGCGGQSAAPAGGAVPVASVTNLASLPQARRTDLVPLGIPTGQALPLPPATLTMEAAMIAANPIAQWSEPFDGWKYMANADKERLQVDAICTLASCHDSTSPSTKQGILDFIALNRKWVDKLDGKGEIEVVFLYPLPTEEYNAFLRQSGLNITICTGYFAARDAAGPSIGPDCVGKGDPYYEGVIDVVATADAAQVKQLLQDTQVYAVEVIRGIAIQKARAYLAQNKPQLANVPVEDSHSEGGLYIEAETAGLVGKSHRRVPLAQKVSATYPMTSHLCHRPDYRW